MDSTSENAKDLAQSAQIFFALLKHYGLEYGIFAVGTLMCLLPLVSLLYVIADKLEICRCFVVIMMIGAFLVLSSGIIALLKMRWIVHFYGKDHSLFR